MWTSVRSLRGRALVALASSALVLPALLGFTGVAQRQAAAPGDEELFNLEHVFNFDPAEHDPRAEDPADEPFRGSDLEFFTHVVPKRDYRTGALLNRAGKPFPDQARAKPVVVARDFAVMGSYQRGAYVFDITNPEKPQFVTQVTCRQNRNDVGIKKFTDKDGRKRVVLALSQQTGDPCGAAEDGAVGFRVNAPKELAGFHSGVQWAGTAEIDEQAGQLVYAGTGCTLASYAPVAADIRGNIALVDSRVSATNPADECPVFTFFQKVRAAQTAGAIGFVQIPAEGEEPRGDATAINADIPAVEVNRTDEALAVRDAIIDGTEVSATLDKMETKARLLGEGSGGIGVFDITDPYKWREMYRLRTDMGGVHNFIFHPRKPYGYVSNGGLTELINTIPIVDFTDVDNPKMIEGPTTEGGVHDIEFSIDGSRAYAASEHNYRIYDTTDPANPVLLSRTPNVGTYAHGVFPSPDLELMVTNNESLALGGFFAAGSGVCPGEGLASYDITDEGSPRGPLAYYTPNVVGPTDERPCTSHFGRFAPGTRIMSIGWYMAGTRIVDWSDPSSPVEVAAAVLEDTNTWAAKFHKGPYVYAGDIGRGFDVFRWSGEGRAPWLPEKSGKGTKPKAPAADASTQEGADATALAGDVRNMIRSELASMQGVMTEEFDKMSALRGRMSLVSSDVRAVKSAVVGGEEEPDGDATVLGVTSGSGDNDAAMALLVGLALGVAASALVVGRRLIGRG
ncbi:MAG: PA domain-containing protein [Nitriliruptorales bacterium]